MSANFAFYVHHHGSGHIMRALAIASRLENAQVTFLGSDLARFDSIIPKTINCIHLPGDVAGQEDQFACRIEPGFLHYAPLNVQKVAGRAAAISAALHELFPVILIVDVSVEVTLLATLCGTPTVVIRQNGDRNDQPHLHAYQCAQLLVAPSPEILMNPSPCDWVNEKTFFSGGFSKYSGTDTNLQVLYDQAVGVIVGSGGTSLNGVVIMNLANQCGDKLIHVIGQISELNELYAPNVVFHGQLDEPLPALSKCDVVIGNAGHNTVLEMADLGKRFVCIPEDRPFREQLRKAELLEKYGMAVVVQPEELGNLNWNNILEKAKNLRDDRWNGVINHSALTDLARKLHEVWDRNFPEKAL